MKERHLFLSALPGARVNASSSSRFSHESRLHCYFRRVGIYTGLILQKICEIIVLGGWFTVSQLFRIISEEQVAAIWRISHNEELHNLHFSPDIIKVKLYMLSDIISAKLHLSSDIIKTNLFLSPDTVRVKKYFSPDIRVKLYFSSDITRVKLYLSPDYY